MPKKISHEDFCNTLKEKWGTEYEALGTYIKNNVKILFRHTICGNEFESRPNDLLQNKGGCFTCKYKKLHKLRAKTPEQFEEQVKLLPNASEYTFLEKYYNNDTKIKIRHDVCGHEYSVAPIKFLDNRRCPQCNMSKLPKVSKGVKTIEEFLRNNGISFDTEVYFDNCKSDKNRKLYFDFAIHVSDTEYFLIEFDGKQHFQTSKAFTGHNLSESIKRDSVKDNFCKDNGITLHRIIYTENIEERLSEIFGK
jgi:DNA-directed RNA polymerase subunit RPC12/RpoP